MAADYDVIAPIYDQTGMNTFGANITRRALDFVQRNDWMGRQILDLGCGTGASIQYLSKHGYILTAVDQSPDMLNIAKTRIDTSRHQIRWLEQDILELADVQDIDLAIAFDVIHEFDGLQELDQCFKSVQNALKSGRLFLFDIYTLQGLVERSLDADGIFFDNNKDLFIVQRDSFDYEKLSQQRDFIIFREQDGIWQRQIATRTLRSYSVRAIATQLTRSGLNILHVLKMDFKPYGPEDRNVNRVLFVAQKR